MRPPRLSPLRKDQEEEMHTPDSPDAMIQGMRLFGNEAARFKPLDGL